MSSPGPDEKSLWKLRRRQWAAFAAWERSQPPPGADLPIEVLLRWADELRRLAQATGALPREPEIDWEKIHGVQRWRTRLRRKQASRP